jgi:hypothetical protein
MRNVNSDTPRTSFTIAKVNFTIPEPFNEGDTITEGEASSLNQTLRENVRNNLASEIEEVVAKAKAAGEEPNMTALQARVDGYVKDYEFGVRQGGGGRVSDPVEARALEMARDKVREKIRSNPQHKLSNFKAADITNYARQVLEKNPALREQAKQLVEQEQQMAASILDDITISNPTPAPTNGSTQAPA